KPPAVRKSNDKSEVVEAVAEALPSQSTEAPEPVEASESLEPSTAEKTETKHSPAVRKLLEETGIDPKDIEGTGKDG
ncbi:MAG TPA: hypothetical protein DCY32_08450, partial [Opitutae bacterium]|nr:hypothetical protein [Opitutae bacterium]